MDTDTERYFLGANSANGFFSLYDTFVNERSGDILRIIKGGPGCGKSTFMRKIGAYAHSLGASVEYIHCSGDIDSLDGIYIKEASLAYTDGTAPHIIEPLLPGAAGSYLNLGTVIRGSVRPYRDEIARLFDSYKSEYRRAYDYLHAYSVISAREPSRVDGFRAEAKSFTVKNLLNHPYFREKKRFLSAYTGCGAITLWETAEHFGRVRMLSGSPEENDLFLQGAYSERKRRGGTVVCCADPICPALLQALIFPEEKITLFSSTEVFPGRRKDEALINAPSHLSDTNGSEDKRIRRSLLDSAQFCLRNAKEQHDALEALYRPHIDFSVADDLLKTEYALLTKRLSVETERK